MRRIVTVAACAAVLSLAAVGGFAQQDPGKLQAWEDAGRPANPGHGFDHGPGLTGPPCYSEDITGAISWDFLGDPDNEVRTPTLTCVSADDIGWTGVTLTTAGISWGQESNLQVAASDGSDASTIQFFPGAASSGTFGPTTGNLGSSVAVLPDMVLRMEFHETSFDDNSNAPDATYTAGSIDVDGVFIPVELTDFSVD